MSMKITLNLHYDVIAVLSISIDIPAAGVFVLALIIAKVVIISTIPSMTIDKI